MNSFEKSVKQWVEYDNQLKILNNKIKCLRESRAVHANSVLNYVKTNNMQQSIIKISDGQLKFSTVTAQQSLTFKYLELCLNDLFTQEETKRIISHIKNKREPQQFLDIKRFSSK
jgi:hypothetical protein